MASKRQTSKASRICSLLEKKYGSVEPPPEEERDALEEMVVAILMDYVPRSRALNALQKMKKAFVDWNEVRVSTGREIAEAAADKGITVAAGRLISGALRKLYDDRSILNLDFLRDKAQKDAVKYLQNTLELTPKQVAWIMLYGMGKSAIYPSPAVIRIAKRTGLVGEDWDEERIQKSLERTVPRAKSFGFCEWANLHASKVCVEKSPRCSRCVLLSVCDYGRERKKKKRTASKRKKTGKK